MGCLSYLEICESFDERKGFILATVKSLYYVNQQFLVLGEENETFCNITKLKLQKLVG